jgi:hypothetical protein
LFDGDSDSVVRATYTSCESSNPNNLEKTLTIRAAPDQFQLSISFDQTESAGDFFSTFSYSVVVPISVNGDNGDGAAAVDGTGTGSATGKGYNDDCTFTMTGSVTFSTPGTLTINPDALSPSS